MHPNEGLEIPRGAPPRVWTGLVLNGNYKIDSLIEQCSTFELYDGTHIGTNDRVCLKILLPQLAADPKTVALFLDEVRVMAGISHPGLLRYRACGRDPQTDLAYIVMDSPGPRLSARLVLLEPTANEILELSKRLASALAAAHRSGLIHGHLSPATVLLPEEGYGEAAITGFSLIRPEANSIWDHARGDAGYLAPEQLGDGAENVVGPWTDVYSLALVILATLNGRDGCRDVDLLPRKLRPIFTRMLEAEPRRRFRSMDDVVDRLDRIALDSDRPRHASLQLSRAAGAVARGSLAMAAVLIAATPWLLQTSLPQAPADARSASMVRPVTPPLPADAATPPKSASYDATEDPSVGLSPSGALAAATRESSPPPAVSQSLHATREREPRRAAVKATQTLGERAVGNSLEAEAEQTARLNADQVSNAASSIPGTDAQSQAVLSESASPEIDVEKSSDRTVVDSSVAAVAPVTAIDSSAYSAAAAQAAGETQTFDRDDLLPLLGSESLQLSNVDTAQLEQPATSEPAQSAQATEEEIAARATAERVRASAERKVREWCKAQRRRCTFPTRP